MFQAESLQRGLKPEPGAGSQQNQPGHQGIQGQQETLTKELQELERKMKELEFEREERCRKIMHRRVQQVNTLQELGELQFITVSCRLQIRLILFLGLIENAACNFLSSAMIYQFYVCTSFRLFMIVD